MIINQIYQKATVMKNWYQIREQSAGKYRLELLWWVYKICGVRLLKIVLYPVVAVISIFARDARQYSKQYRTILNEYQQKHNLKLSKFSSVSHIYAFARAAVDKMSATCDKVRKIKFLVHKNADWDEFNKNLESNTGVFLICSHLGNIEALSAFPGGKGKKMHAFMQISQSETFHKFMMRHNVATNTTIYPTEDIGIEIAGEMYDNLQNGDLVMMAGDRTSPNAPSRFERVSFLGRECAFPVGTFKFARAQSHPIFAICLMNITRERYAIYVQQIKSTQTKEMIEEYARFLERLVILYPKQWFNFFDFFKTTEKTAQN